MGYLLGIDGGGTHTTACLAGANGRVLSRVVAGPSNPVNVGIKGAQHELLRAVRLAWDGACRRPERLDAVCVGLAGAESPSVHDPLVGWLRQVVPARAHLLTSDAAVAFTAAIGESAGILVIAGTGSIAYGRDENGLVLRAGGWGNLFDDAGSGYDIGRKAVGCALRALDGREEPTRLEAALARELGLARVSEIVAKGLGPREVAALYPAVLHEAVMGDPVAGKLCVDAAHELAGLALAVISRFGWKRRPIRIATWGGVFCSSAMIRRIFAQQVRAKTPWVSVSLSQREPVEGALDLALQIAHSK